MSAYSLEETEWWVSTRLEARDLRSHWATPTDYFSSVKVLTNEAVLRGKKKLYVLSISLQFKPWIFPGVSLSCIMEPYHMVGLMMGS